METGQLESVVRPRSDDNDHSAGVDHCRLLRATCLRRCACPSCRPAHDARYPTSALTRCFSPLADAIDGYHRSTSPGVTSLCHVISRLLPILYRSSGLLTQLSYRPLRNLFVLQSVTNCSLISAYFTVDSIHSFVVAKLLEIFIIRPPDIVCRKGLNKHYELFLSFYFTRLSAAAQRMAIECTPKFLS